jgi:hypothetical protein
MENFMNQPTTEVETYSDGIKDKERVKKHGEVFTPDSIVNDMLDLTDDALKSDGCTATETPDDYISKTYLEPACGNGNFLIRILDRKLAAVRRLPESEQELGLVKTVATIYGIDIQEDNVIESRERMMELIKNGKLNVLELEGKTPRGFDNGGGFNLSPELDRIINTILTKNIVLGNALETNDSNELFVKFIDWKFLNNKHCR